MTNLYELFFWGIDANNLTIREDIPSAILIPNQGKWIKRLFVSEVKPKRFRTRSMLRSPKSIIKPEVPISPPAAANDISQFLIELWAQLTAIKVTK
jgi:hypothetical protein